MKKQMKWLLAALALAALATPAFAVTADMTGTLGVRGFLTNNLTNNNDTQDHTQYMDQRFRLFTSVAANENVKAVLGLEVDNVLGRTSTTITSPATTLTPEVGAMAADAKGQLEIKHLYLDFKIPAIGANVKAGTQPFNFGRGLVMNDDAAGIAFSMPCKVNPNNKLDLTWIKISELVSTDNNDDGDFFGAKYSLKVGDVSIAPYVGSLKSTQSVPGTYTDVHAAFYGVDVDGKSGDFTYALTAISNQWSRGTDDGGSVSLFGKGTYAMGDTTLSVEAASYGDEDNSGQAMSLSQSTGSGPMNNFSEIFTGGQYTANNTGYGTIASAANGGGLYSVNFQYLKVGAVHKLNDKMKVSAFVMNVQEAADRSATQEARTFGNEIDTYFDYTIVPGLGLNVAAAYLIADDEDFGEDNAYKLATSLNYKF